MVCPECRGEFRAEVATCPDCLVALVAVAPPKRPAPPPEAGFGRWRHRQRGRFERLPRGSKLLGAWFIVFGFVLLRGFISRFDILPEFNAEFFAAAPALVLFYLTLVAFIPLSFLAAWGVFCGHRWSRALALLVSGFGLVRFTIGLATWLPYFWSERSVLDGGSYDPLVYALAFAWPLTEAVASVTAFVYALRHRLAGKGVSEETAVFD